MVAFFDGSVLALIADRGVSADQHGSIFLPDSVDPTVAGEVRLRVVVAIARSLAYRTAPQDTPGVHPVVLSTLGEVLLRRGNPDVYRSRHAFEVRDGKVSAQAVTR